MLYVSYTVRRIYEARKLYTILGYANYTIVYYTILYYTILYCTLSPKLQTLRPYTLSPS